MDRAVTWLDELVNLPLVARNTFRERVIQRGLSVTSNFLQQPKRTDSAALEKTSKNYALTNKAHRSIAIKYKKVTSISSFAHTILCNSSKKDGLRTQNNEHCSVNSFTNSRACFDPSCSHIKFLSEGNNVLKAFAPHQWEAQFADGRSYHRRRRLQFRTQIPASNKKKLDRLEADWFQAINCCTLGQEDIPHLYKGSGMCDNKIQLPD